MMVEFVDWGSVWEQFDEWSERAQANSKHQDCCDACPEHRSGEAWWDWDVQQAKIKEFVESSFLFDVSALFRAEVAKEN